MQTREFRPGDILVACDNMNGLPPGYMGHAAIAVDASHLVEATTSMPQIRMDTIQQYLSSHPLHVQYRPVSAEQGKRAAKCAMDYVARYQQHLQQGLLKPEFSFFTQSPLDDPWEAIYCSKLVWLCYYYCGNHRFSNDFLLFTPEDLSTQLEQDRAFTLVYRHPQFGFKVDT